MKLPARFNQLHSLANEAAPDDGERLVGFANDLAIDADGWALVSYGEWDHARGIQRFGRSEAEEIVRYFKNAWNTIKRAIVGLPVYRGHPDQVDQLEQAFANERDEARRQQLRREIEEVRRRYPDRNVYGSIADLEVRDDGLAIKPVLTGEGAALVNEQGLKAFSPHWLARKLGTERGREVFAPAFLLSIGLTDRPNIAGTSLVNSRPGSSGQPNPENNMKLPAWLLTLLGFANEAEPTQEEVTQKVQNLLARPEQTALANEQSRVTTLTGDLQTANTALANERAALANERTAHAATRTAFIAHLVNSAVADGRITEADKPVWTGRLGRDFATESTALANEKPKVKLNGVTTNMGGRASTSAPAAQFEALVNEALPQHGNDRDRAWAAVKASKAGKALWEQMHGAK